MRTSVNNENYRVRPGCVSINPAAPRVAGRGVCRQPEPQPPESMLFRHVVQKIGLKKSDCLAIYKVRR